jgi:hypothetical protein
LVISKDDERLFQKTKPISRALPGNPKSEYLNPKRIDGCVLKKQTQFFESKIGANSYLKGDYDNKSLCGA